MIGFPAGRSGADISDFLPTDADGAQLARYTGANWEFFELYEEDGEIQAKPELTVQAGDGFWIKAKKDFTAKWKLYGPGILLEDSEYDFPTFPGDDEDKEGDLSIYFEECPTGPIHAGSELYDSLPLLTKSTFSTPLNHVIVDLVLTATTSYPTPAPVATYSENYSDGILLKGGREHMDYAGTGYEEAYVALYGDNMIPDDTPSGTYYLAAVIDAGNQVGESSETNNVDYCKITIIGDDSDDGSEEDSECGPPALYDATYEFYSFTAGNYEELDLNDYFTTIEHDCPITNFGITDWVDLDGDGFIDSNDWINGMALDNSNGLYSGTPATSDVGKTVTFTATATNAGGTSQIIFEIEVQ